MSRYRGLVVKHQFLHEDTHASLAPDHTVIGLFINRDEFGRAL
ncbi:MAG: hypothetical protein AAGG53_05940 [Cyanobacteria bacterium P01_H01_bin.152]